jgi:carbonic anhydrase/acetyltransferase-like protein (isoleucine patch superfamily)
MPVISFRGKTPRIGKNVFIAEGAMIIGDVTIGDNSSVWYNAVLRADIGQIILGQGCNVQDNATIHVEEDSPAILEDYVTMGHAAIVHGAHIKQGALVGMQSVVLTGAVIGEDSIIGAGAVVGEKKVIPPLSLVVGIPGKVVRQIEAGMSRAGGEHYVQYAKEFLAEGHGQPLETAEQQEELYVDEA